MTMEKQDTQFPVWVATGRDANAYHRGALDKIKNRLWKVASFNTQAEADACKLGITSAMSGGIHNNVAFVEHEEAVRIDKAFCEVHSKILGRTLEAQ